MIFLYANATVPNETQISKPKTNSHMDLVPSDTHCCQFEGRVSGLPLRAKKVHGVRGDTGNLKKKHEFHKKLQDGQIRTSPEKMFHIFR